MSIYGRPDATLMYLMLRKQPRFYALHVLSRTTHILNLEESTERLIGNVIKHPTVLLMNNYSVAHQITKIQKFLLFHLLKQKIK